MEEQGLLRLRNVGSYSTSVAHFYELNFTVQKYLLTVFNHANNRKMVHV